jgi:hypothetical protein
MRPPIDGNGSSFETVSALALMAADTVKVRIGCLVFCVNYRQLAEAGNSADRRDSTAHSSQRLGLGAISPFDIAFFYRAGDMSMPCPFRSICST